MHVTSSGSLDRCVSKSVGCNVLTPARQDPRRSWIYLTPILDVRVVKHGIKIECRKDQLYIRWCNSAGGGRGTAHWPRICLNYFCLSECFGAAS